MPFDLKRLVGSSIRLTPRYAIPDFARVDLLRPDCPCLFTFKVKCKDINGNEETSNQFSFITPRNKENIIQIIIANFEDIFGWVKK